MGGGGLQRVVWAKENPCLAFERGRGSGGSGGGWLCQVVGPSISHLSDGEVVVDINKEGATRVPSLLLAVVCR